MLTRTQKEEQVTDLRDRFARAVMVCVADYRGLDVPTVNALRGDLRQQGEGDFEYRVTKNAVLRRAVADTAAEAITEHFSGPTAVAFSYGDPVGLAKVLVKYDEDHEVFDLKGGFFDGKALSRDELATLATLPSLDELRGKIVGLLQAPATKLVRLLVEPASQVARLVEARRAQIEEGGA